MDFFSQLTTWNADAVTRQIVMVKVIRCWCVTTEGFHWQCKMLITSATGLAPKRSKNCGSRCSRDRNDRLFGADP